MSLTEFPVEHVLTFTAYTAVPAMIAGAPQGTRGVLGVTSGTFEGPRLSGTIAGPGGDWFTVRTSGSLKIDVRLLLVADDGANILLTYSGIGVRSDGGMEIRIAGLFEAPDGPHGWLNDLQVIGVGHLFDGGVSYEVYALR